VKLPLASAALSCATFLSSSRLVLAVTRFWRRRPVRGST
jgi:hypothetical protein